MFQTARNDLSVVVTQAQKELSKLTRDSSVTQSTSEDSGQNGEDASESEPPDQGHIDSEPSSLPRQEQLDESTTNTRTLFSRLSVGLPPNIVLAVNGHLPESLRHASENIDLAQLRSNLLNEFQRVQGVTRTQAEEYVHKSEALLREAMKEAGEVLRDAVKIIPPEDQQSSRGAGLVWDGTDMWALPEPLDSTTPEKGHSDRRSQLGSADSVATRAEFLLRRLKHDPAILKHDPEADAGLKELYSTWISLEVDSTDGGMDGEEWKVKSSALLDDPVSGEALKATLDALVPSELTRTTFWKRFFFRVHQIEVEAEKRKALIEGALEEEDFSWEDDEEEPTLNSGTPSAAASSSGPPSMDVPRPLNVAASESGEESYDVLSSGNTSPKVTNQLVKSNSDTGDPDSDWE